MGKIFATMALLLLSIEGAAAQTPAAKPREGTVGIAAGPRRYLSGARRLAGAVQVFGRLGLTRTLSCEAEFAGGGGSDADFSLPPSGEATPVVTHFAGNLSMNLVFRTPGRVGFLATAGPGLYVEQRDTELRRSGKDKPEVIGRDNDYTFGAQASAGVDIKFGSSALFSVLRYEARALRAPDKRANWEVLTGMRFPLW